MAPLPRSETEWGRLRGGVSQQRHPEQSADKTRGLNHEPVWRAQNQQLIVGHRLVQGHLQATIVVKASFWHSCCWWAPPTPNPSHSAPKTPLRRRGPTADCQLPIISARGSKECPRQQGRRGDEPACHWSAQSSPQWPARTEAWRGSSTEYRSTARPESAG